jgi:hypothetical protein
MQPRENVAKYGELSSTVEKIVKRMSARVEYAISFCPAAFWSEKKSHGGCCLPASLTGPQAVNG